ncbi:hypothetical protein ZWY2020_038059 [Hordeum vulgare]|nr:hypothetical protein ZWY2020_038059 [Hordeum vulgare]
MLSSAPPPLHGDGDTVGTSRTVLPANTDQTLDASSNHTPNDDNANEDEGMPEVMSTPQQPTTMMRFDTLEDAEKHYKMYARQKGFGVRSWSSLVLPRCCRAYILKRWTWLAEEMLVDMSPQVPGKVHEMPEESVILMKTTLMKNEFASLAKVGCRTTDGRKIIGTHLKEMKRELAALAKE